MAASRSAHTRLPGDSAAVHSGGRYDGNENRNEREVRGLGPSYAHSGVCTAKLCFRNRLKRPSLIDADAGQNAQRKGHAWSTMARRLIDPSAHRTAANDPRRRSGSRSLPGQARFARYASRAHQRVARRALNNTGQLHQADRLMGESERHPQSCVSWGSHHADDRVTADAGRVPGNIAR